MRTVLPAVLAVCASIAAAADTPRLPLVVEAADATAFTLANATVVPIPGTAERGILLARDDASATLSVKPPPGSDDLVLRLSEADDEHDAVYVGIVGTEYRVRAGATGGIAAHQRVGIGRGTAHELPLTVENDHPVQMPGTAETGVIVERVTCTPVAQAPTGPR